MAPSPGPSPPPQEPTTARLRLHCRGVVQGVGFRPAVHRLAAGLGLSGSVENLCEGVGIELAGPRPQLEAFLRLLSDALPPPARLERLEATWLPPPPQGTPPPAPGLRIAAAPPRPLGIGLVAPSLCADRAPCPACLAELEDPADRRFRYPFLSCSACGPRYSIATAEPYARAATTMAAFPLCPACQREFEDPADRRFHAETLACPACGPRLALWDREGRPWAASPGKPGGDGPAAADPLAGALALLEGGGILALQGVGGFQLLVDAGDPEAVARLRARKRRPARPFALLVAAPEWIEPQAHLEPAEREALLSPAAPIVLLRRRPGGEESFAGVAPGSPVLGVMLPASPLHHLLVRAFGRPLVATSGNRSGEPLCTDPREAVDRLAAIADAFLVHDRPIARSLDDSVLHVIDGRPALLRRARGYAPEALPLRPPTAGPGQEGAVVLALGGDLKAAPALARGDRAWLAPHLGDAADSRVLERLRQGLAEMGRAPEMEGARFACDAHPGYLTHHLAAGLGRGFHPVQHHLAHGLAVMAEHHLEPPLLVVAFDGLGYGELADDPCTPGHRLWGGELLLITAEGPALPPGGLRLGGLRPFPLPGGERAMGEPRRAALGLLAAADLLHHPGAGHTLAAFNPHERELLLEALAAGCNSPTTSSVGRLFDGVASLLGLVQRLTYEGEGGLRLEGAAAYATTGEGSAYPLPLRLPPQAPPWELDWRPLLRCLLDELAAGVPAPVGAARFQAGLVAAIAATGAAAAERHDIRRVALAGGCFQNRQLLTGAIQALRRRGLDPFWPERVPCGDGGLALGQIQALRADVCLRRTSSGQGSEPCL